MYGLLVENFSEYVKAEYGEDKWEEIRRLANINQTSFSTHKVYEEDVIPKLARTAVKVLGVGQDEFMFSMGEFFIGFVGQYGYDRVLSVLGRHVRDFLNGLDNLHEYLKFSYPLMKPPSFFCECETSNGMLLHYRSKRKGYAHYTMGQIKEVARRFYNTEIEVVLLKKEFHKDTNHVTFQLTFDNRAFANQVNIDLIREEQTIPLRGNILFEIFPFCILFGKDMVVKYIGNCLMQTMQGLVDSRLDRSFKLLRPHVEFTFQSILKRTNNIFEVMTVNHGRKRNRLDANGSDLYHNHHKEHNNHHHHNHSNHNKDAKDTTIIHQDLANNDMESKPLNLKGQMIFMEDWDLILFLGTPVMPDLDSMIYSGLFINDLSMHDFSRDLMLAGTQQSVELELALSQEQLKSKKLEESMKKLDEEMRRTDELLYQMIPMQVAQRLRNGENPVDTCETFESVTILFSDVVNFTSICSRITPMEVVSMLNEMYSIFDTLTEKHRVYKVETIGDAYMVVAGAPERQANHGEMVCNMSLDMVEAITKLTDPSTGNHLRIRVGVHTGTVVAGVVGLKMPRYCLFGDAVNTASRMESTSEVMKIHVSQTTRDILSPRYSLQERAEIFVKGKGDMKTYWLLGCEGRMSCMDTVTLPQAIESPSDQRRGSNVSRNYSPILPQDVARRSLTTTPTPQHSILTTTTTPQHSILTTATTPQVTTTTPAPQLSTTPTQVNSLDVIRARGRTFSNAGFSSMQFPSMDGHVKASPTDEMLHVVMSACPLQASMDRPRYDRTDKPHSAPTIHCSNHKDVVHTLSAPPPQLLPDVLIDNHRHIDASPPLSSNIRSPNRHLPHIETSPHRHQPHPDASPHRHQPHPDASPHRHLPPIDTSPHRQQLHIDTFPHRHLPHIDTPPHRHQTRTDASTLTLSESIPSSPSRPSPHHAHMVDRGTSPIVSHAACSGFSSKNRIHSHTCAIL